VKKIVVKEGHDREISVALQCVAMTGSLHWGAPNYRREGGRAKEILT
jgi:hypothetical protein